MPTSSSANAFSPAPAFRPSLRDPLEVPPFAHVFRETARELAPFRDGVFDLEPALREVMEDYPKYKASGQPIDRFFATRREPRRPESDYLLRAIARDASIPVVTGLLQRYGELAKTVFPDVTALDLLKRASGADSAPEVLDFAKDTELRATPFKADMISPESFMPFTASVFRGFREVKKRLEAKKIPEGRVLVGDFESPLQNRDQSLTDTYWDNATPDQIAAAYGAAWDKKNRSLNIGPVIDPEKAAVLNAFARAIEDAAVNVTQSYAAAGLGAGGALTAKAVMRSPAGREFMKGLIDVAIDFYLPQVPNYDERAFRQDPPAGRPQIEVSVDARTPVTGGPAPRPRRTRL